MENVLVAFSSPAEQHVYQPIVQALKGAQLEVVSAEREPGRVDQCLKRSHNLVIAGSANGAHLPAAIASRTMKPVIGVPVKSHFDGVDALLSMLQMPAGVPILTVGVNQVQEASRLARKMLDQYEYVNLFGLVGNERAKTCKALLEKFKINYEIGEGPNEHAVNINFTSLTTPDLAQSDALIINVPLAKSNAVDDVKPLLENTQKQLWVGVNRGDSAAIAAMQILNFDGRYESDISAFRESLKSKAEEKIFKYADVRELIKSKGEIEAIARHLSEQTYNHNTLIDARGAAGQFRFNKNILDNPVLLSKTSSVGQKAALAQEAGMQEMLGADLVHHCVNSVVALGADPLFFSSSVALQSFHPQQSEKILKGMTLACAAHETVLLDVDIAKGSVSHGAVNLFGTVVGAVDKEKRITGQGVIPGDVVIGLASNGLHMQGFDIAKGILIDSAGYKLDESVPELNSTLKESLLRTTRPYYKPIKQVLKNHLVKAMVHVTEGGLRGGLVSALPSTCNIELDKDAWAPDPLFELIAEKGNIPEEEMYDLCNMGIGFVVIAPKNEADTILKMLHALNVKTFKIGIVKLGKKEVTFKQGGFLSRIFGKKQNQPRDNAPRPASLEGVKENVANTIGVTSYALGEKEERDDLNYDWYNRGGLRIRIATDRGLTAGQNLETIPFKGQVLNQLSVFWWNKTKDIVKSAASSSLDPNVVMFEPIDDLGVQVHVHQYLTGELWSSYEKGELVCFDGLVPEHAQQYHRFETPVLTFRANDSCKTKEEVLAQNILDESSLQRLERYAHDLFRRGTEVAAKRGLVLVSATYAFGRSQGRLVLTDEIHTPRTASFWFEESLASLHQGDEPIALDINFEKEFSDSTLSDDAKVKIATQYLDLYEAMTGQKLLVQSEPVLDRVEQNIARSLQKRS